MRDKKSLAIAVTRRYILNNRIIAKKIQNIDKKRTINAGYVFSNGKIGEIYDFGLEYMDFNGINAKLYKENLNPPLDKNSYDNKMILRGVKYAYLSRYSNNQSLSLDSQGFKIYEE